MICVLTLRELGHNQVWLSKGGRKHLTFFITQSRKGLAYLTVFKIEHYILVIRRYGNTRSHSEHGSET